MADVSSHKTRQRGMAFIGIAFSIGFLLGPLVGAGFAVWAKGMYKERVSWVMEFLTWGLQN